MDIVKGMVSQQVTKVTGPPIWQSGICDCTLDTGICCQTLFCHLCTFSNMQNKRDFGVGAFDCCACCAIMFGSYGTGNELLGWMSFGFRRELVQRYGIQGETVCKSCCFGYLCGPCSICQVQREMGMRKEHCGGCCANPPPDQPNLMDKAMGAIVGTINSGGHVPRIWGSPMCGCTGAECVEGLFCPCCMMGFMGNKLDSGRVPEKPLGGPAQMDPISCCGFLWYPQGHIYANRREVIERYNIGGETHTMTCINTLFCPVCALCQQRREMGYANEWPGGLLVKDPPPKAV